MDGTINASKIKIPKVGFYSDAIEEPYSKQFLKEPFFPSERNISIFWRTFFHLKNLFLHWKGSMNINGSSTFFKGS